MRRNLVPGRSRVGGQAALQLQAQLAHLLFQPGDLLLLSRHCAIELLEQILVQEEESVDWHETQLSLIRELGKERYLAEMIADPA